MQVRMTDEVRISELGGASAHGTQTNPLQKELELAKAAQRKTTLVRAETAEIRRKQEFSDVDVV